MFTRNLLLREGIFSPDNETKATNSEFNLKSLVFDFHNKLKPAKNKQEKYIRHFIKTGSWPEKEEEPEQEEHYEHHKEIHKGPNPKGFLYYESCSGGINMDSYMDHLLILDEFASPYSKNNWNKHHQDIGARSAEASGSKYNGAEWDRAFNRWDKDRPKAPIVTVGKSYYKKRTMANSIKNRAYADTDSKARNASKDFLTNERRSEGSGYYNSTRATLRRYKIK